MNHTEIKAHITQNLADAGLDFSELRVQPDPFSGWRIVVIAPGFSNKSYGERKAIVLKGLEETIQWLDLLTPEEQEWAGSLPIDSNLEDLPLWPEALARSMEPAEILFPSDLDDDLEKPIIATFYSLRGGVGRSTALAYTARILASRGRTVLCVDMDLEAPGLTALLGKEDEIQEGQGLVFVLSSLDQGEKPDLQDHILRVSETDELYCLPAGLPNANYARLLNFINPEAWYREEKNPLRELIQMLGKDLSFKPDVILLDARTGITPLNAPLLFDLADLAMVVFFPHPQAQVGTEALVRALLCAKTRRKTNLLTPEPRFIVSPIPASKAREVIERYQHRALEWIGDWLSSLHLKRAGLESLQESDITHFIPYQEEIATSDQILSDHEIWREFEVIAEWLERFLPTVSEQRLPSNLASVKDVILQELEFSAGTAENQSNLLETFVETDLTLRALDPRTTLVIGRKGMGKTAIFRRLSEKHRQTSFVILSPSGVFKQNQPWILNPESFQSIEIELNKQKKNWRDFWLLQTCLACYLSWPDEKPMPVPDAAISYLIRNNFGHSLSKYEFIKHLKTLLSYPDISLLARDWITRFDQAKNDNLLLLFDGLDTGFGNTEEDRKRRTYAIEGLLALVMDLSGELEFLKFKLFLRDDIWRKLRFDNKSHFFGRSVTLSWGNKSDFLHVIIKQALQSNNFKELLRSAGNTRLFDFDYLNELQVLEIWNILVGERMRSGKSAFTRNWVWNRIADGSNNHSPRTLLQLFVEARNWEIKEQTRNPDKKTIIRPRALNVSLETVSQQALDALVREEFPELETLIRRLREIGRSPINANELKDFNEQLSLAKEIGLLSIYEGTENETKRYKVPDLYLSGIGMTRSGQG